MVGRWKKAVVLSCLALPTPCLAEVGPNSLMGDDAITSLFHQIELNQQFVTAQIASVNQAVLNLTSANPGNNLPGVFEGLPSLPLLAAFAEIREAREDFVASYSTFLGERIETLSSEIDLQNAAATEQFLTSGSIFDSGSENTFPSASSYVIPIPVSNASFPGFGVPITGFFGPTTE